MTGGRALNHSTGEGVVAIAHHEREHGAGIRRRRRRGSVAAVPWTGW
jgi:hypothetical protein